MCLKGLTPFTRRHIIAGLTCAYKVGVGVSLRVWRITGGALRGSELKPSTWFSFPRLWHPVAG